VPGLEDFISCRLHDLLDKIDGQIEIFQASEQNHCRKSDLAACGRSSDCSLLPGSKKL
jgi:hypothetical protein